MLTGICLTTKDLNRAKKKYGYFNGLRQTVNKETREEGRENK
jgi:hypothetical protein